MRLEERGGVLFLRFEKLLRFPRLEHFFVTRHTPHDVRTEAGREALSKLFDLGPIFVPWQVHGSDLLVFEEGVWYNASCCMVDAVLTREKNRYLGILVADCVPLLLFAPEEEALAVVHAGWKGIVRGIHTRVLEAMQERFSVSPSSLWAGVGPAIGQCCFEVGEEVAEQFVVQGKEAFVEWRKGKTFVDLKGIVVSDLVAQGVREERVEVSPACTSCEKELFHSFRRDGGTARCLLVAGIRG